MSKRKINLKQARMNNNQKALKLQEKLIVKNLRNKESDYWSNLLNKQKLNSIIEEYSNNYRKRIYTPKQTLSMFLTQAFNEDNSCQRAVNDIALNLSLNTSTATGAYCKARKRLDTSMIIRMCKDLAIKNSKKVKNNWKVKGRNIYLVDGTTITMPDTKENQKEYPQPNFQKEGLGFPICRVVSIVSLETGCIVDTAVSPFSGKGAAEQALLRSMLDNFKK